MNSKRETGNSQNMIHNIDVTTLKEQGRVNVFDQQKALKGTVHQEGLCAAINTTILLKLFSCKENEVQNFSTPLANSVFQDILQKLQTMTDLYKEGENANHAPFLPFFNSEEINRSFMHHNDLPLELKKVHAATLTYKTKQGLPHQVAFYRYDSDKCYIVDANRLVSIKTDVDESLQVLHKIIARSNPESVEVTSVPIKIFENPEVQKNSANLPAHFGTIPGAIESDDIGSDQRQSKLPIAKECFVNSFISAFLNEMLKDFLPKNLSDQENGKWLQEVISLLNVAVRGDSVITAAVQPVAHYLLKNHLNADEKTIDYVMTGIMLMSTALKNPREMNTNMIETTLGMAAGLLGSYAAKKIYEMIKEGVSTLKNYVESQPESEYSFNGEESDLQVEDDNKWNNESYYDEDYDSQEEDNGYKFLF